VQAPNAFQEQYDSVDGKQLESTDIAKILLRQMKNQRKE